MSSIVEGVVVTDSITCDGCGLAIETGQTLCGRAEGFIRRRPYHDQCHAEAMCKLLNPEVVVGASRERLTGLRAQVQLGVADTDTLRTVLLALMDEVLR